jgi:hypothetical protein
MVMSDTTKFLWDNSDKRVKKLEIPDQGNTGLAKVHAEHLRKEALKQKQRGIKNEKNRR